VNLLRNYFSVKGHFAFPVFFSPTA